MIRDNVVKLIYRTAFCALAVVGFLASLGLFEAEFKVNFYVYFTNLSNYICMFIGFAELKRTIKAVRENDESFTDVYPRMKFIGMVMIFITFTVYNFLLAKDKPIEKNMAVSSIMLHIVLPLMYIADWVLFSEHKKVKKTTPLLSVVIPILYAVFVFVRAELMGRQGEVVYPYFFLDVNNLGWGGVSVWIAVLIAAFVVVGYMFYFLDGLIEEKKTGGQK
ncbi:MAG: Pr6Pr family membrane protein [Oscillospiraceae bacterium]|nr:Pr6Pr family membrane protein [Oscillospiraceae bacterium]